MSRLSIYGGIVQDDGNQHCEVGESPNAQGHLQRHKKRWEKKSFWGLIEEPVNNSKSDPLKRQKHTITQALDSFIDAS